MSEWSFSKGLHDLGNGCWGYILPDGSWGYSNAGLIEDGGKTLLVDTLFDLKLTGEMLDTMRRAVPAAKQIETLVNTHANGDHTYGNQLVEGARILTTANADTDMGHSPPDRVADMLDQSQEWGEGGAFMRKVLGAFEFRGITLTRATDTFEGALDLSVGNKAVRLVDVGPAHTRSDVLVHVPDDRIVFTGDILFADAHPAIWAGPVRNWIAACDLILSWDVDVIVPGHGPIVGKAAVRDFKAYLEYIWFETSKRYEAGMHWRDAAFDIALGEFSHWRDAERMIVNVMAIWGELSGTRPEVPPQELWTLMARYFKSHEERRVAACGCAEPGHCH